MAKHDKKVRIFSALEVANICGVVNQTAINWIKNGYLKAFTTPGGQYRVYSEDLVDFLAARNMRVPNELTDLSEKRLPQLKILIVDDDVSLNNLIKQFLEKKFPDITLFQAYDGFEAGKIAAEERPKVIILDVDLPGINGRDLCKKIKADPGLGNPRILVITGLEEKGLRQEIMQDGTDAFMAKPLDFDEFTRVLLDFLKA